MTPTTLERPDGRVIAYQDSPAPQGTPVLFCHGGPGCRLLGSAVLAQAHAAGLRLVGIDRPGYGGSSPQPGRTIAGWTQDAIAVADRLGLERFALLGYSTGGAYAVALASQFPQRVIGAVVAAGVSDLSSPQQRASLEAAFPLNKAIWGAGERDAALALATARFGPDGAQFLTPQPGEAELAPSDMAMFADAAWFGGVMEQLTVAFAQGVQGYVDDRLAETDGWVELDLSSVRCPVLVCHGSADNVVPPTHGRHTANIVPGAELKLCDGLGHFSIDSQFVGALSQVLA